MPIVRLPCERRRCRVRRRMLVSRRSPENSLKVHVMQSKHSSAAALAAALLIAIATGGVQPRAADAIRQTHSSHDGATSAGVTADRIVIGAEYFARRTDLAKTLIVAARQTVEALGDATYDYIEVAGTLKVSRTHDTTLPFTHLVVLPGGVLDVGTQADPIPCDRKVEL